MGDEIVPAFLSQEMQMEERIQEAVYSFNTKRKNSIQLLLQVFEMENTPDSIGTLMHNVTGLGGKQIGDFLSRNENTEALKCYFRKMDLHGPFLTAMRTALSGSMHLPVESEQIDRIMSGFSQVYLEMNPESTLNTDSAHILAFAIIMLNTDLHNPSVPRRMTAPDFIRNIRGALPPSVITDPQLLAVYQDLKSRAFNFNGEQTTFLELAAPRRSGFLSKKQDSWTSFWTNHFFVLANSCLYYFKDNTPSCQDSPLGMIQLVAVEITIIDEEKNRILIDGGRNEIQYVKFMKRRPEIIKGVSRIFLEAPNRSSLQKWFYRLRQSVVCSNFNDNTSVRMSSTSPINQSDMS